MQQRPLYEIAAEIREYWRDAQGVPTVNYAAVPYLDAMECLHSIDSTYGMDPARHIVRYFLSNARSFRGPSAQRLKAELKAML